MKGRPGVASEYVASVIALGFLVLGGVGLTIANLRDATPDEALDRWRLILGWSLVIWSAAFLAYFLLSKWAYGCMRAIRAERPRAIVIRSGTSPVFKSLLEDHRDLRVSLARTRPPFVQFVLVFDSEGLEVWHGSGRGRMTGALPPERIVSISTSRTNDGIWPFNVILVEVAFDDDRYFVPFVVRGSTGYLTARRTEVERIAAALQELYTGRPRSAE
jgi:hypothetical protein